MIPNNAILSTTITEVEVPSKTFQINYDKSRVGGYIDSIEAVRQAVYLILNTERYVFPIYSWNYGVELSELIGKPMNYAIPEIKRRITEALLQDDRIASVDNFEFEKLAKNKLHCSFTVTCNHGALNVETEVQL